MLKLKSLALLFFAVVFLMSGCIVTSINPLYTENDLVYDEGLIGSWRQQNDNTTWMFRKGENTNYQLIIFGEDGSGTFDAHLVRLGDQLFLDMCPAEPEKNSASNVIYILHLLPTHSFLKVNLDGDTLKLGWMSIDLFSEMVTSGKDIGVSYQKREDDMYLLTSPSEELQEFIIKGESYNLFEYDPFERQD